MFFKLNFCWWKFCSISQLNFRIFPTDGKFHSLAKQGKNLQACLEGKLRNLPQAPVSEKYKKEKNLLCQPLTLTRLMIGNLGKIFNIGQWNLSLPKCKLWSTEVYSNGSFWMLKRQIEVKLADDLGWNAYLLNQLESERMLNYIFSFLCILLFCLESTPPTPPVTYLSLRKLLSLIPFICLIVTYTTIIPSAFFFP